MLFSLMKLTLMGMLFKKMQVWAGCPSLMTRIPVEIKKEICLFSTLNEEFGANDDYRPMFNFWY